MKRNLIDYIIVVLVGLAICFLASCSVEKKARKAGDFMKAHPEYLAPICHEKFPVIESVRIDTIVDTIALRGDDSIIYKDIDTTGMSAEVLAKVREAILKNCPANIKVVKETKTITKKDSAELFIIKDQLDVALKAAAEYREESLVYQKKYLDERDAHKATIDERNMRELWMVVIIIILALIASRKLWLPLVTGGTSKIFSLLKFW